MYKLINTVQHYSWGSISAIPDILGIDNIENKPYAELWIGEHHKAVSKVLIDNKLVPLNDLINENPMKILGGNNKRLPYLLKILAAYKPLSIQLHPDKKQAESGFKKENKKNISIEAPFRNYRDENHKPEIIYALSRFTALKGFLPYNSIYNNFYQLDSDIIYKELEQFNKNFTAKGLEIFFTSILKLSEKIKNQLIKEAEKTAKNSNLSHHLWLLRLINEFGNDIGVLAPFFLNIINLEPGNALFIKAGELHAYLEGTGIELMASSDNVLRGGLTKKHIDIKELITLTNFSISDTDKVNTIKKDYGEIIYMTDTKDFQLSKIEINEKNTFHSENNKKPRIILCLEGKININSKNRSLTACKGESIFIPAYIDNFSINGKGLIFKAI